MRWIFVRNVSRYQFQGVLEDFLAALDIVGS
jgi:hypothetical protein